MHRATVLIVIAIAAAGGSLVGCGGGSSAPRDAASHDGNPDDALPSHDGNPADGLCQLALPASEVAGVSCRYSLPDPPSCEITSRSHVTVTIDGAEVPMAADNGWTYADAGQTAIELHGQACDLASGSSSGVIIQFRIITV